MMKLSICCLQHALQLDDHKICSLPPTEFISTNHMFTNDSKPAKSGTPRCLECSAFPHIHCDVFTCSSIPSETCFKGPVRSTYPTACPSLSIRSISLFPVCSRKTSWLCVGCEDELLATRCLNHRRAQASGLIIFHADPTYLCLLLLNSVRGHLTTLKLMGWGPRVKVCLNLNNNFIMPVTEDLTGISDFSATVPNHNLRTHDFFS